VDRRLRETQAVCKLLEAFFVVLLELANDFEIDLVEV